MRDVNDRPTERESLPAPEKVVGLSVAARFTGLPASWLRRWAQAGLLPCARVGNAILFDVEAVRLAVRRLAGQRARVELVAIAQAGGAGLTRGEAQQMVDRGELTAYVIGKRVYVDRAELALAWEERCGRGRRGTDMGALDALREPRERQLAEPERT